MAFIVIDPSRVDAKSPIDDSLMQDIKTDLDELQAGSGGSGGGGSGIESLSARLFSEQITRVKQEPIDNSISVSAAFKPAYMNYAGRLISDLGSAETIAYVAWNPIYLNNSDKDFDSTTNITVAGAAINLTTSATRKVGTASIQFDKDNSNVYALATYTRAAQDFSVGSNENFFGWVYLPSITQLAGVVVRACAGATSDYAEFLITQQADGSALAVGENFVNVNLSGTPTTTGGTPWTISQFLKYWQFGVKTTSGTQTYANMRFDAFVFSQSDQRQIGSIGQEYTLHDNSNRFIIIFDASNSRNDGPMVITSATGTNVLGGSGAAGGLIKRTVLTYDDSVEFPMDRNVSGSITEEQELRACRFLRETVSGDFEVFFDVYTPQSYRLTGIPSTDDKEIDDPSDTSADLLSGDTVHVFQSKIIDGEEWFIFRDDAVLTSNSSSSGGTTTLTSTSGWPSGITVNDMIVKKHIKDIKASLVAGGDEESFSNTTEKTSPNGVILINDSNLYPNPANVYGHWQMGGFTDTEALLNRKGPADNLLKIGTPNLQSPGARNRFSAGGWLATLKYLSFGTNFTAYHQFSLHRLQHAFWMYFDGAAPATRTIMDLRSGGNGMYIRVNAGNPSQIFFGNPGGGGSEQIGLHPALLQVGLNHIAFCAKDGEVASGWVNGTRLDSTGNYHQYNSGGVLIGQDTDGLNDLGTYNLLDYFIESDSPKWTDGEVKKLANARIFKPVGNFSAGLQYHSVKTGMSGQKASYKASLTTSTDAITVAFGKSGMMITS